MVSKYLSFYRLCRALSFFTLLALASPAALFAAPLSTSGETPFPAEVAVSYAAVLSMTWPDNSLTTRVYHTPDKERRQVIVGREVATLILRRDLGRTFVVMSDRGVYLDYEGDQPSSRLVPTARDFLRPGVHLAARGEEVVNGIVSEKYAVTSESESLRGFLWVSREGIITRLHGYGDPDAEAPDFTLELSDLEFGSQPATLFEPPADLERVTPPPVAR